MAATVTQVTPSSNVFLNAIQFGGWIWTDGPTPGTNITYYIAPGGIDLSGYFGVNFGTSVDWLASEVAAFQAALQQWAHVANVTFTLVTDFNEANLIDFVYTGGAPLILGIHDTPMTAAVNDGIAIGAFNALGAGFTSAGLQPGGFGFITLVHELGHALGLAHPHDNGGGSGLFPGVVVNTDRGDNDLNQGIFTLMGYNDGWQTGLGVTPTNNYGWQSGPSAFDIAAIQYLYGANASYNAGNNTYVLGHQNGVNDALTCIWDTGGTDTIAYSGIYGCTINLNAATLQNEPGGGGFVSYVDLAPAESLDHWNAFTIANGVVIENATGGSGDDVIYLSSANVNNLINGNGGTDYVVVSYFFGSGYAIQAGSTASNFVMLGSAGVDTFLNCEYIYFADDIAVDIASLLAPPSTTSHDFNGDGTDDILWYNSANRGVGQWVMNNGNSTWDFIATGGNGWQIAGTGDFNGNNTDDILWYNSTTHQVGQWVMNNGNATWDFIATGGSGSWQIAGTGDFNGNGTDDILWFNSTTHQVGQWVMNNGNATWDFIATGGSGSWQIVGTGDFNGNGTDDILWYNSATHQVGQWVMNNGNSTWDFIATGGGGSWQIVGMGDFNGDGTDDILWYNTANRGVGQWVMNNGNATWDFIATGGSGWEIAGTGDFNGNGTDDILWYNSATHQVGQWVMSNGNATWDFIATTGSGWDIMI